MGGQADADANVHLQRITRAHELLSIVSRQMSPAVDLETTLREVILAMRQLVQFRGGSICLEEDGMIRIAAADPEVSADVMAARLPVGQGLAGRVVESGELVYSPDLDNDERVLPELRRLGTNAGIVSYLGVPLVCLGRTIGLLQVDSPTVDAFDETDQVLLGGLASQMANAIQSARQIDERLRLDGVKHAFIGLVSHELRTPLTIATGMLQTYRSIGDTLDRDEREKLLDRSEAGLQRLNRLIEELILMSELTAGALTPNSYTFHARPVIDRVIAGLEDAEAALDIAIECPDDATLTSDPNLVARILEALVENALHYAGDAEVIVRGNSVTVQDHGPGLPHDVDIDNVEIFSRSETNPTTTAGLGLGLSMVTALVTELDATFTLASQPGVGTRATVDFGSSA